MAVNLSEECQSVHSVLVVLRDGEATKPQDEPMPIICVPEVPNLIKNGMCLNSATTLLQQTGLMMDEVDNCAPCGMSVDLEKGKGEILKSSEESFGNLKSDDSLARALQKEIWLQLTGKFMQFMNSDLLKVSSKDRAEAERVYNTLINRSRKFKRSSSFNSRKVVLLFSVVSCLGTIILIYLTLRVRVIQISDGSGNA